MASLESTRPKGHIVPLATWLWRAYLRSALIPVLAIELTFLALYWASTAITFEQNSEAIGNLARDSLNRTAEREAQIIGARLDAVADLTHVLVTESRRALTTPYTPDAAEIHRYAQLPDGRFVTQRPADNGLGAAAFFSGIVPLDESRRQMIWRSVQLDPVLVAITNANPLIVQAYLNTPDSYNRIYPYFDVASQYPPKMDIPSYNFYYEADQTHDPERKSVWTDAYVDPAGSGWMVSSIAPVYDHNQLLGVVGIDVTIANIVAQVLDMKLPWNGYAVLVGRDGTLLALPPAGETDWGLRELTDHSYQEAVLRDTFKPESFRLGMHPATANLAEAIRTTPRGGSRITLNGQQRAAAWSRVYGPDWTLLVLAPETSILAEANQLNQRLRAIGWMMVGLLLGFYLLFLTWLVRRAMRLSVEVREPIGALQKLIGDIGQGQFDQPQPDFRIEELQSVGDQLVTMGARLGEATVALHTQDRHLRDALHTERRLGDVRREFIRVISHEFRTPLAIVDSTAQTLARRAGRMEPQAIIDRATNLRSAASRLGEVLDGALALARQDSEGRFESLALPELINEAAVSTIAAFPVRHNDLSVTVADIALRGDRGMLRVLLATIIDNALRYSQPQTPVEVRAWRDDTTVEIDISDQGPGIEPERVDRLMERLAHNNQTELTDERGIGLPLAATFARWHGGQISITSAPHQGTTVRISLPANGNEGGLHAD